MERKSVDGLARSAATLPAIGRAFEEGRLTAERLVERCLDRIEAYDRRGPRINAVINLNPEALQQARDLDRERERGGARGPLHGIPVVVKDTIDVAGMPTTGGFTALAGSRPLRDAAVVRRLHDAGAVMLAKVNANDWFSQAPMSASTLGGQTLNPHHLDYVPGGSSCGTGAALAANYAPLGLGTDASGSVLMPAADSGVLGLIPSRGLVSRAGSMCMAPTIGRLGIMARSAFDLAALLSCLAGWDPEDMTSSEALEWFPRQPYESQLAGASLGAFRIGVLREMWRDEPRHGEGIRIMERLLGLLRRGKSDPGRSGADRHRSAGCRHPGDGAELGHLLRIDPRDERLLRAARAGRAVSDRRATHRKCGRGSAQGKVPGGAFTAAPGAERLLPCAAAGAGDAPGRPDRRALPPPPRRAAAALQPGRCQPGRGEAGRRHQQPGVPCRVALGGRAGGTHRDRPADRGAAHRAAFAETTLLRLAHLLDQAAVAVRLPAATPPLPGEEL